MSMPRGQHPKTLVQRDGRPGHWSVPAPQAERVETRDAPMRAVAWGLVWTVVTLLVIVAAVLVFAGAIKPRTPLLAGTAERRFHTAGPPLLTTSGAEGAAVIRAHSGPGEAAIQQAMRHVVQSGWGDTAAPPGRADVAMGRAEAGQ